MAHERTMIQVENLAKHYGDKRAVDGISFEVPSGEVLGFLGPNGAGKSTTMKMLTCFLAPTSGTARVRGMDVLDHSMKVRESIGYLPEDTPLYPDMTVLEYLRFAARLRQVPADQATARIREIVEVCGLRKVLAQPVGELSKGFRQRVGLAQALVHDPPILILDEPTSGLDPNQIVEIRELIKRIGREKTVILSTHILPEVQATCGRVIIIAEGKLAADGSPEELATKGARNDYSLLIDPDESGHGEGEVRERLGKVKGITGVRLADGADGDDGALGWLVEAAGKDDLRRELSRCARDNGWLLLGMQRKAMSLEDVFRKLTTE